MAFEITVLMHLKIAGEKKVTDRDSHISTSIYVF